MGYLVHLGSKENAPERRSSPEQTPLSPEQRRQAGMLTAVILAGAVAFGLQAVPLARAALFPVASRDLPPDADPGAAPTREDTGVYDRRVAGGVAAAGGASPQALTAVDDPSERPYQRGAGR